MVFICLPTILLEICDNKQSLFQHKSSQRYVKITNLSQVQQILLLSFFKQWHFPHHFDMVPLCTVHPSAADQRARFLLHHIVSIVFKA